MCVAHIQRVHPRCIPGIASLHVPIGSNGVRPYAKFVVKVSIVLIFVPWLAAILILIANLNGVAVGIARGCRAVEGDELFRQLLACCSLAQEGEWALTRPADVLGVGARFYQCNGDVAVGGLRDRSVTVACTMVPCYYRATKTAYRGM